MTVFAECLAFVLAREGGYVDNAEDPGGATNKGITQRVYTAWRASEHLAARDVRDITDGEVQAIYFGDYWKPVNGDALPAPVALCVFDSAVQHGVGIAQRFLTECGPDVDALCDRRLRYYRGIVALHPTQAVFLAGWISRIGLLRTTATAWAAASSPPPLAA